jgi:hypothetical protein
MLSSHLLCDTFLSRFPNQILNVGLHSTSPTHDAIAISIVLPWAFSMGGCGSSAHSFLNSPQHSVARQLPTGFNSRDQNVERWFFKLCSAGIIQRLPKRDSFITRLNNFIFIIINGISISLSTFLYIEISIYFLYKSHVIKLYFYEL